MDTLLSKFDSIVNGVIEGFDRIVFKGMFRSITHAEGMELFLSSRNVLNKDFKDYVMKQSKLIVQSAEEISQSRCGSKVFYLPSSKNRKEAIAHERQKETGIKEGLIGVWSCVEACGTFKSTFNPHSTFPSLDRVQSRCKQLYYYFDDPTYGFMNVRLQTWAPYDIQIAMNGREWLRRSLDANNIGYVIDGNKFLHIDDYKLAQELLYSQREADYAGILNGFLPSVFPLMSEVVPNLSYYWTVWQSEMARDYIFRSTDDLNPLMDDILLHAMITGTGERILKYFGRPVKPDGQPHPNANPEILSKANQWVDGGRVRHRCDNNSVKVYNQHNVLRLEMTMNDPKKFKIHRHSEKQNHSEPKKFMEMRKGIADINLRAAVSSSILDRFADNLAAVENKATLGELLDPVSSPRIDRNKKYRALDVFGKDWDLFRVISDPAFNVSHVTNKTLQKMLIGSAWAKGLSGEQLSARITRHLKLLREHGIIKKLPNQRKYSLTNKGRELAVASTSAHAASVVDLLRSAA